MHHYMKKSGEQIDIDDTTITATTGPSVSNKYSRSQSESSSQSQIDNGTTISRSKHFPLPNRKQQKSNIIQSKTSRIKPKTTDVINYFDNNDQQQMKSNDQWGDWEDSNFQTNNRYQQQYSNDRRHYHQQQQQRPSDDLSQKPNRYNDQTNDYNRTKQSSKTRSNASRSSDLQSSSKSDNKIVSNKPQPAWRALSPPRPLELTDPTPQESTSYIPKTNDINDRRQSAPIERKQRYPTTLNTSSIPPLMSVRSDVPPTSVSSSTTPTTTSKTF